MSPTMTTKTIDLYTGNTVVEHGIAPPMYAAVSLPLRLDGVEGGLCVYVMQSPWSTRHLPDAELQDIAREIARLVNANR